MERRKRAERFEQAFQRWETLAAKCGCKRFPLNTSVAIMLSDESAAEQRLSIGSVSGFELILGQTPDQDMVQFHIQGITNFGGHHLEHLRFNDEEFSAMVSTPGGSLMRISVEVIFGMLP